MVDSTLSIGAGPLIAPADVSERWAIELNALEEFLALGVPGYLAPKGETKREWSSIFATGASSFRTAQHLMTWRYANESNLLPWYRRGDGGEAPRL